MRLPLLPEAAVVGRCVRRRRRRLKHRRRHTAIRDEASPRQAAEQPFRCTVLSKPSSDDAALHARSAGELLASLERETVRHLRIRAPDPQLVAAERATGTGIEPGSIATAVGADRRWLVPAFRHMVGFALKHYPGTPRLRRPAPWRRARPGRPSRLRPGRSPVLRRPAPRCCAADEPADIRSTGQPRSGRLLQRRTLAASARRWLTLRPSSFRLLSPRRRRAHRCPAVGRHVRPGRDRAPPWPQTAQRHHRLIE